MSMRLTIVLVLLIQINSFGQVADSTAIKKGWNFGALPALGFDSNLGFLYGGLINLYDYGNGERYADYNHSIYMQIGYLF